MSIPTQARCRRCGKFLHAEDEDERAEMEDYYFNEPVNFSYCFDCWDRLQAERKP